MYPTLEYSTVYKLPEKMIPRCKLLLHPLNFAISSSLPIDLAALTNSASSSFIRRNVLANSARVNSQIMISSE